MSVPIVILFTLIAIIMYNLFCLAFHINHLKERCRRLEGAISDLVDLEMIKSGLKKPEDFK